MPHIHEQIDYTAEVFIVYQNKVLLRQHDKYKMWLSVGGHVELDEDPNQAAVREVKEEVGLDVILWHANSYPLITQEGYQELIPPQFMNRHRINPTHEHVTLVYFASSTTDQLILSEHEQSEACRWFTKGELDNPVYRINYTIKMYAKSALEKLVEH